MRAAAGPQNYRRGESDADSGSGIMSDVGGTEFDGMNDSESCGSTLHHLPGADNVSVPVYLLLSVYERSLHVYSGI